MNKEKIIKGVMWLSLAVLSIILSAIFLFAGFHNITYNDYTLIILSSVTIPLIFFFAYKGFKLILDAIFY